MLRFGGTLVCLGIPEGEPVPIAHAMPATMIAQQLNVISVTVGNRREAVETLEIAARGVIKFPIKVVGMSELQSVFDVMAEGKINGRVVLDLSRV
ncbi:hypothetical protein O1611_g5441 [Lasiodiplodia mahajangana]|uniref:Uncharacterized protein n=1 Tax=Lasiodiplodia mahajangana TaxID=1108764 RepID=A0ACC2JL18_9PEZI|nr:hypothetical protein O1611_g5441 [Lasiodiplodia mahajangana]